MQLINEPNIGDIVSIKDPENWFLITDKEETKHIFYEDNETPKETKCKIFYAISISLVASKSGATLKDNISLNNNKVCISVYEDYEFVKDKKTEFKLEIVIQLAKFPTSEPFREVIRA